MISFKNKTTKNNLFVIIIGVIFGLILLFFVTLYIFVPTYRFEDPSPFSGKFIHNPYQELTNYNWNYYDFRDSVNDADISSYEYGWGISSARYLCIDNQSERKIDYPLFQNIHFKQHNINCLNEKTSLVVPTNLDKGFKLREIKHLDNYRLMEVMSAYGRFFAYWDAALSSGRRVNILVTSDTSNKNEFEYKTVVNEDYINKEQLVKSLKDGDFYAISYKKGNVDLPKLKNVFLNNDTVYVTADKMIKEIRFIGQNGIVKDSLYNVNQGIYVFKEDDSYVRTEIDFDDETTIYLNPIVRHQFQYFFDPTMSEMMTERTWLMRIIYVCVIIFFVKYLVSKKDDEMNNM